jgi:subtilisin family serine protease
MSAAEIVAWRNCMSFDRSNLTAGVLDPALRQRLGEVADGEAISVLIELRREVPPRTPHEACEVVGSPSRGLYQAWLTGAEILELAASAQPIYRIWLNHVMRALTARSIATIQGDAALAAFQARGREIVWAVADSGIAQHGHFDLHQNLVLPAGMAHRDFTGGSSPLSDEFGHGTAVAGILAGEGGQAGGARGVAPETRVVSLKVLDRHGVGEVSRLLSAIDYIQQVNDYGRRLRIHGLNLSLGYDFDPEWFACGASPLCVEVDRLVQCGVCVVSAAGNSGYGVVKTLQTGASRTSLANTINDPGNAELAITVGSTHREMPHTYGVSYFSSKGPTGDGRRKPDLIAPGERIVSCAAPGKAPAGGDWRTAYVEDSGTSMAAPHVSGAIAAFLSVRREFRGRPLAVKQIFLAAATDLHREPYFQGRGLLNLFQALQER